MFSLVPSLKEAGAPAGGVVGAAGGGGAEALGSAAAGVSRPAGAEESALGAALGAGAVVSVLLHPATKPPKTKQSPIVLIVPHV